MLPVWNRYQNHRKDIWDSLALFLEAYAFERQGRRPDYFHVAVDALFCCKDNNSILKPNLVNDIWKHFSTLLNNKNLNYQNNPLYPGTNPDNKKVAQKTSVIEFVINKKIIPSTFTTYFQNQINQGKNIENAFNLIKSIRGIGDKIASFYLRDLADTMEIDLNNIHDRFLLQPIDIWVERTVKNLAGYQKMEKYLVAKWIVDTSIQYNINPERVNMGIWFFGSHLLRSEYRLNNTLKNFNSAQELVNDFRRSVKNVCQNC